MIVQAINFIMGIFGAVLGGALHDLLGLAAVGLIGKNVIATVGAIFLVRQFGGK